MKPTDDEIAFMRHLDGGPDKWADGSPMCWGAAMSVIISSLKSAGYVTYPTVKLTPAGRTALKEATDAD